MPRFWELLKAKYQAERLRKVQLSVEHSEDKLSSDANAAGKLWLIAGLGNFGPEYEQSRHNCGFRALDALSELLHDTIGSPRHRFKGVVREAEYEGQRLLLLWPQTYMNASGDSIGEAMRWYGIDDSRLIVLYDDTDIDLGMIRIRSRGSAGTHNGMKSVLLNTETDAFPRIRIGIGKKPEYFDMVDFVLGKFTPEEKTIVSEAEQRAAKAALAIVSNGCERAMSEFNSSRKAVSTGERKSAIEHDGNDVKPPEPEQEEKTAEGTDR